DNLICGHSDPRAVWMARRRRKRLIIAGKETISVLGSGTSVAIAGGEGSARLKFAAIELKSSEFVTASKLKSPCTQSFPDPAPKLLARALKSRALTTPSR